MSSAEVLEGIGRGQVKEAKYPGIAATVDGSGAVVWVESHITQAACAYPITPSTPMGDGYALEFSNGKKNVWDQPIQFLEPESEHSSASACEGFALAGGRVTNFTSGQGLILMKEVLYVISGKRLPIVFHIGARALTSHSLNIHCGHDDVMGVADCGWGMLFGRNAQEAADLALIARRVAEDTETPFFNIQDGFLTTHTLESIHLPEPEFMAQFIGAPEKKLHKLFDPTHPVLTGCVQNQDSYMKGKVAQRQFYERILPELRETMREFTRLTGREYTLLRTHHMEDAERAIIGLGSMMETAEAVVDHLREQGVRVGSISLTSFRPFPSEELAQLLAKCHSITVIERADIPLAQSNPLTMEVRAALSEAGIQMPVISAVAGLGGRDVRAGHIIASIENMRSTTPKPHIVLGVKHEDAVEPAAEPDLRPVGAYSMRGHSIGGYGSVTTNKVIASVASTLFDLEAQAFSKYGSEKKGLPTSYFLTLAPEHVRLHAEPTQVDFVAIQDGNAFLHSDPLAGIVRGGTVYIQSAYTPDKLWPTLPAAARTKIREFGLKVFALDAQRIARESSSRPELQVRMQGIVLLGAFLKLTPFAERAGIAQADLFPALEKSFEKYFGKRGRQVIEDNMRAAHRGYEEVQPVVISAGDAAEHHATAALRQFPIYQNGNGVVASDFCSEVVGGYLRGREPELPADEYVARSFMPPSTAALRSFRNLAPDIPQFVPDKCVGCMECVNVCPDTAILAKAVEPDVLDQNLAALGPLGQALRTQFVKTTKYFELIEKKGQKGGLFGIFVDADKCKGCGECVVACGKHEALSMVKKDGMADYDAMMQLYRTLPPTPKHLLNEKSLGDIMLGADSLLYAGGAGSCMGCGEATSLRMLLAATGHVYGPESVGIVAATGCNTVYGSTYPFNPFAIPWTNSLFENAPAVAMGVRLNWDQQDQHQRRLWVLGGDGAMYDIGFQALSRMVMSGMDIKVLVLDTQVYSNTGGQTSTATFTSQDAKMSAVGKAQHGKRERRKELSQILLMHPGVFVAQTTPAHLSHFYKTIMAANEYPGPAVVVAYSVCQPEHGVPDDHSVIQAKLAADSRAFPIFTYDPRKGDKISERLDLAGNPAQKEDWYVDPRTNKPVDFVSFARTEGRFARHFDKDGNPDETLLAAQADRLESWHRLQELAGLR